MIRAALGRLVGLMLAPITGIGALLRQARFFHPEGVVYRAMVRPLPLPPPYGDVAKRLTGQALVRLSTAWWRHGHEWLDVLGCAIRFRGGEREITPEPEVSDQDLLFATVRWPWTTLAAPLMTHQHDFLGNNYHGVSPFDVTGLGPAKWRLISPVIATEGRDRGERLDRAVSEGRARFTLQVRRLRAGAEWVDVADLWLRERVDIDQSALHFSPFRSGRGIRPRGFVQGLRAPTYAASQRFRPAHDSDRHPV